MTSKELHTMIDSIAFEVENLVEYDAELYRCPHCQSVIVYDSIHHDMEEDTYECNECSAVASVNDFDYATISDYIRNRYMRKIHEGI